eukprot:3290487-Rhodomonas_salina.2
MAQVRILECTRHLGNMTPFSPKRFRATRPLSRLPIARIPPVCTVERCVSRGVQMAPYCRRRTGCEAGGAVPTCVHVRARSTYTILRHDVPVSAPRN